VARASASLPADGKTSPPSSTTPTHAPAPRAEIEHSRAQLERFARSIRRELEFTVDDESGRTIITVRNKDTGEVVRQIPSEEVIALARAFAEGGPMLLESEA
jgi:flagellar protein FlaG